MAKKFKFEKILKDLVDFYNESHLNFNDYPNHKLSYDYVFFYNKYNIPVKIYDLYFNDTRHKYIIVDINGRLYKCLSFASEPIDVILYFLESCLKYYR